MRAATGHVVMLRVCGGCDAVYLCDPCMVSVLREPWLLWTCSGVHQMHVRARVVHRVL